jgi:hypothetical protein
VGIPALPALTLPLRKPLPDPQSLFDPSLTFQMTSHSVISSIQTLLLLSLNDLADLFCCPKSKSKLKSKSKSKSK